jgi:hypothetical protein
MTAQEKPAAQLQSLAIGPTADEIEKAKNKPAAQPGMMPPGISAMPPMPMPTPGRVQK